MDNLTNVVRAAKRVSVPILQVKSFDPDSTIKSVISTFNDRPQLRFIKWDVINGLVGINESGKDLLTQYNPDELEGSFDIINALSILRLFPEKCIIFAQWTHKFMEQPQVSQGLFDIRNIFKSKGNLLILINPEIVTTPELRDSIINIQEKLPEDAELGNVVLSQYNNAKVKIIDEDIVEQCVVNLRGMSRFGAEQLVAMAMTSEGVNLGLLNEVVRNAISDVPGLSVVSSGSSLNDIGGLNQIKSYINLVFNGRNRPAVVVHIDEIEKAMAGYSDSGGGDSTGVSADQLGTLLSRMEDYRWQGFIFVGAPGTGKSFVAKSIGETYQVPTIALDLGAAKNSLVGSSEARIRYALEVIENRAKGQVLVIATSNGLKKIPPELRRRFTYGIVYFDLPDEDERESIWKINKEKFGLNPNMAVPDRYQYTGADIRNMCNFAASTGMSLVESSRFNVPVAKSDPGIIEELRNQAESRYLSASYPGEYRKKQIEMGRKYENE